MIRMIKAEALCLLVMIACVLGQGQKESTITVIQPVTQQSIKLTTQIQKQPAAIKFHTDQSSHHITIIDKQYAFIPQINQHYSIVNTMIYPKTQQKGKFVASVPTDNFLNKHKQNNPEINNKQNKQEKLNVLNNQQKAHDVLNQQKAHDILKGEIDQQQQGDKNNDNVKQQQLPKEEGIKSANKATTIPKPNIQQLQVQKDQNQQIQKEQDIFTIYNKNKQSPKIQLNNQKINFKQDHFSKPLQIKNYPYEEVIKVKEQSQNKNTAKNGETNEQISVENKQIKNTPKEVRKTEQQQEKKSIIQIEPQKNNKIEPKKEEIAVEKPNLKTQKQPKPQQKLSQPKQIQKQTQQQLTPPKEQQQQISQSFKIDQQYKILSAMLSIDKNQLRSVLDYKDKVQDQIQDNNWKYLIAKALICIVIVISLYQAMCSSDSRLTKAEKEKYAPVDTEMFDSRDHLEVAERISVK